MWEGRRQAAYEIVQGDTRDLPDVRAFVETLGALVEHPAAELRTLFDPRAELFVARAPGRLDVMGGIGDYSGSLVLELPTAEATLVALQKDEERRLRVYTLSEDESGGSHFEMPLADFEREGQPVGYEEACDYFGRDPARHWAAYVAGVFLVLMRERGVRFREGARILVARTSGQGREFVGGARSRRDERGRTYAVRVAAAHAVYEHFRVDMFVELLGDAVTSERRRTLLGELMYQSHASYSACGLGSEGTDRLVELVEEVGHGRGLYGAKITGGGSGGTVAVLGRRGAEGVVAEVAQRYAEETGHVPHVFGGSSPGAASFGHVRLRPI